MPSGDLAKSPDDSIKVLLDKHFQGSLTMNDQPETDCSIANIAVPREWLSVGKICEAIKQFVPNKVAGLDGLKPITL
jgi:hypothetical protein